MNSKINMLLTGLREQLESAQPEKQERLEDKIRDLKRRLTEGSAPEDAEPGDLGATNPSPVDDDILAYLSGIVDSLLETYDISEDDAFDFVLTIAELMSEEGMLPPVPADDDPEVTKAEWLGTAKTVGLAAEVLASAEASADDE